MSTKTDHCKLCLFKLPAFVLFLTGPLEPLGATAKERGDLKLWRPPIINHLYWTAASTLMEIQV